MRVVQAECLSEEQFLSIQQPLSEGTYKFDNEAIAEGLDAQLGQQSGL